MPKSNKKQPPSKSSLFDTTRQLMDRWLTRLEGETYRSQDACFFWVREEENRRTAMLWLEYPECVTKAGLEEQNHIRLGDFIWKIQ